MGTVISWIGALALVIGLYLIWPEALWLGVIFTLIQWTWKL